MRQLRSIFIAVLCLVCTGVLFVMPVRAEDASAPEETKNTAITKEAAEPDPDSVNFSNRKYTGVAKDPKDGKWYRIKKGKKDMTFTGLTLRPEDGEWYFVRKGTVRWKYTGTGKDPETGKWYRVTKGKRDLSFTGLTKRPENGKWYYIQKGEWLPSLTGVYKDVPNKRWVYVKDGKWDRTYTGVAKSPVKKKWYRIRKGVVDLTFTGRAKRPEDGKYYYIKDGRWDKKFTGFYTKDGKKRYFQKGKQVFGWVEIKNKYYYLNEKTGVLEMTARYKNGAMLFEPLKAKQNGKLIVLDPGHASYVPAGSEPIGPGSGTYKAKDTYGARGVSSGITEAALNLTVAQQLRTELVRRGYKVALTRESGDVAISCIERTAVANRLKASAYIRIHADSSGGGARGAQTICISSANPYGKKYAESASLSYALLNSYCAATGIANRGIWYTDTMTGNNWSDVPTTLIEMGFLSNSAEDIWMNTPANQKVMVNGMANGIDTYFGK